MNLNEAKSILKNNGFILTKNQLNENTVYGIDSKKWEEMRKNYDYYTGDQIDTRNNGRVYCLVGCGGAIKGPGDFGEIVSVDELNHKIKFKNFRTNNTYEYNIDTKPNWEGYAHIEYKKNELYDRTGKCYKIKNIQGLPENYDPDKPFSHIIGQLTEYKNNIFTYIKEDFDMEDDSWPQKMIYTELKIEVEPEQKQLSESWTLNQAAGLLNEEFTPIEKPVFAPITPFGRSGRYFGSPELEGLCREDWDRKLASNERFSKEEVRKIIKQREMLHEETDSDSSLEPIFETLAKTRDIWLKEFQETLPVGYHATAYTGSCANGLSKKIPGIDITRDNDTPPGKITLVNNINPRKIEFEGVGPYTLNGWEENIAIHYPGVRRMATRFRLPGMYNYKHEVAKIISDMVK